MSRMMLWKYQTIQKMTRTAQHRKQDCLLILHVPALLVHVSQHRALVLVPLLSLLPLLLLLQPALLSQLASRNHHFPKCGVQMLSLIHI